MQVSKERLIANVIAIRSLCDVLMLQINGAEPEADSPEVCAHPNKRRSMGGYWFCPDCNTEGRDEA